MYTTSVQVVAATKGDGEKEKEKKLFTVEKLTV